MIYSSCDVECDRLKFIIMGNFLPLYSPLFPSLPITQKIRTLKKWKKLLEISSFYTFAPKTTVVWGRVPEIWSETDVIFCHFGHFLPLTISKIKTLKTWKKDLECHYITHVHQKSQSYDVCFLRCHFSAPFQLTFAENGKAGELI